MKTNELRAVARLLHIALGYDSREVRIGKMIESKYLDVRFLVADLQREGLLTDKGVSESQLLTGYTPSRGKG